MMNSVPYLLPSWHDISLQDLVRQKSHSRFVPLKPPDYGGIGVDVNINHKVHCKVPKYSKSQIRFASEKCALPFMPLSQISNWTDPCLELLEKEKSQFEKFSLRLTCLRSHFKGAFRTKLNGLEEELKHFKHQDQNTIIKIPAPTTMVQLAETIPKHVIVPTFNVDYAGGTLAACKSTSKQIFLHPSCKNVNKLCITPLLEGNVQHFIPDLSEQITMCFEEEPILQIEPASDGFCVRQKNSYHLVNIENMNAYSRTVHNSSLCHIAANPYNPLEILSVYEKGILKLRNMMTKQVVWNTSDIICDEYLVYPPCISWRCSFGSHPFSALCLNEQKLHCFDFRQKKVAAREIFNINNSSFYVGEQLVALKQWDKNPFQYFLASSHHLLLCDERYLTKPVLQWNHCLENLPVYLEIAEFDSDVSIIVIGTQKSPQLASFLCSHQGDVQPVSLSPPLLLSSTSDCVDSLKLHCYDIDDKVSSRLSCPLTGVCVVPHNTEIGFTVLQSTSLGDIFYQDFKQSSEADEKTYHVSTGCVLTPPEKIMPYLKDLASGSSSNEVLEEMDEGLNHIQINIDQILSSPKEISSNCTFCRLYNESSNKELVLSGTCPTCNMTSDESSHMSKALANNSVVIGPVSEESSSLSCDIDYLSQFDDKYSKLILSVWLKSCEDEEMQDASVQDMSFF